jgi:hypothetical protein
MALNWPYGVLFDGAKTALVVMFLDDLIGICPLNGLE